VAEPLILRPGDDLAPLRTALGRGELVVIPTDTVYGIACAAHLREACERLYRIKERPPGQPTAIVCGTVETVFETALPELFGRAGMRARRLLPGPVTLIVPNPSGRFRWLTGDGDSLGVRVPELDPDLATAIDRIGVLAVASVNLRGEPAPTAFSALDPAVLDAVSVAVDGGACPGGAASTIVDLRSPEPAILRAGPVSLDEVLDRLR
jgi:L-threonylcarbamoyladenylate synthase